MNDEETVALIAGGHTFGKTHGAGDAAARRSRARGRRHRGARPRLEEQLRQRQGRRHDPQRPGRRLDPDPTKWDNGYFDTLFGYEWELTKSPAGACQWMPKDAAALGAVPDAHDPVQASRAHRC